MGGTPATSLTPRQQVDVALAGLPRYFSVVDLLEVVPKDRLLDAYVQGWLPQEAEATLEANYARLQCWLLARLIRLQLERNPR